MFVTLNDLKTLNGIIYLIINKINKKVYIGLSKNTFLERYVSEKWWKYVDNQYLDRAIKKYGYANFEIQILRYNLPTCSLGIWETFFIRYYQSNNPKYGYNLTGGDDNPIHSILSKRRKRKSVEQFILEAKEIHGDKYDYSLVTIGGSGRDRDKIEIICKTCNEHFFQRTDQHLDGDGCIKCGFDSMKLKMRRSFDDFVKEANLKHNNEFIYFSENYVNAMSIIKIIHKKCGSEFYQMVNNHLIKHGCPRCNKRVSKKIKQIDIISGKIINIFDSISDAAKFVGLDFNSCFRKIKNVCQYKIKEAFNSKWQFDDEYFNKKYLEEKELKKQEKIKIKTQEFIEKAKIIHNNKYNYDKVVFERCDIPVDIFCNSCQKFFKQKPIHQERTILNQLKKLILYLGKL